MMRKGYLIIYDRLSLFTDHSKSQDFNGELFFLYINWMCVQAKELLKQNKRKILQRKLLLWSGQLTNLAEQVLK